MAIKVIKDKRVFKRFVNKINNNTFLQSIGWQDFNEVYNHKTFLLGNYTSKKLTSVALVLKIEAKRGKFLFIPHGPVGDINKKTLKSWTTFLSKLAKKESCSFFRISPILENYPANNELFKSLKYRKSPIHMHAEHTTVVDLTPSDHDILLNMRKTTRQMVRKGNKLIDEGEVVIKKHKSISDKLYSVYQSTTKRGGFVPFTKDYINQEYKSFSKHENCYILSVEHNKQVLSWGLFIVTPKRCFYHQGANILHKKIPASYICHWQGMMLAKSKGCKSYDFWGVAPKDQPKHPWANISLFKRGFGGKDLELVPAQDYPVSWKYWPTFLFEVYRAKKRGF